MNVNELRAEVLRRQVAAQRKVARLRRAGVDVAGTSFDVRRDRSNVARYNSRQLQKYLGELNAFTSRSNSFVAGSEGTPITRRAWNAYKRVENAYNAKVQAQYQSVENIFIPEAGKTVKGFDKTMRRKRTPGSGGVPRPLEALTALESFQVVNMDKLKRMQDNLQKKLDPGFLPKSLKMQRRQMIAAVSVYGDDYLTQLAKDLTDTQLDTLWNYTDAPRDLFAGYHFMQLLSANKADEAQSKIHEDDSSDAEKWITWAYNLKPR